MYTVTFVYNFPENLSNQVQTRKTAQTSLAGTPLKCSGTANLSLSSSLTGRCCQFDAIPSKPSGLKDCKTPCNVAIDHAKSIDIIEI